MADTQVWLNRHNRVVFWTALWLYLYRHRIIMKHLSIVVPRGNNNLSSIVGTYKILQRANDYQRSLGKPIPFRIELVGVDAETDFFGGLFCARPEKIISDIRRTNLIIIPSLNHQFDLALRENAALIEWLQKQHASGAEIASICTGAFLLAAAGLLDELQCSTHWAAAAELKTRFPRVNVLSDRVITDEAGLYTNGGAFSFLHLILYLVEKYWNRSTAIYCAKVFQIEPDRQSQTEFVIFSGQKNHNDPVVLKAQHYMEKNIGDKFSIDDLCKRFAVGRRSFDRRFVRATGNTPLVYAQRVRMEKAKKLMETSRKSISEIRYESGYTDAKAFRDVFKQITGLSPQSYKKRYGKQIS